MLKRIHTIALLSLTTQVQSILRIDLSVATDGLEGQSFNYYALGDYVKVSVDGNSYRSFASTTNSKSGKVSIAKG